MITGENLGDLIRTLRRHGGTVQPIRRTGELIFRHPSMTRPVRVNGRRKDAPPIVVKFVREVIHRGN